MGVSLSYVERLISQTDYFDSPSNIHRMEGGTDSLFRFKVGDEQYILKICTFNDERSFMAEPYVQNIICNETSINTPNIVFIKNDIDEPFYIMVYSDGIQLKKNDITPEISRSMGVELGKIHSIDCFSFTSSGEICSTPDGELYVDESDDWRAQMMKSIREVTGDIPSRFTEEEDMILNFYESNKKRLPLNHMGFIHGDYRLENILFNGKSVEAVLDWGRVYWGHQQYNIVRSMHILERDSMFSDDKRSDIISSFKEGYFSEFEKPNHYTSELEDMYRLHIIAVEMKWFDLWYSEWDITDKSRRETELREQVREII